LTKGQQLVDQKGLYSVDLKECRLVDDSAVQWVGLKAAQKAVQKVALTAWNSGIPLAAMKEK